MNTTTQNFVYTGAKALENMGAAKNYNDALIKLIEHAGLIKESKVLDFGAGMGTFSKILRTRVKEIDCFEIDADECAYLRADNFTVFENLSDMEDNSYDFIYSLNVLEHVEDDAQVVKELQKKLKPNGRLFIYVPAFQLLYSDFDAMLGHFRRYQLFNLRKTLQEGGYNIIEMHYYDTLGFIAAYIFKFLRSKPEQVTKGKIWFFDRIVFPCNKIMDPLFRRWFGKNIYAICIKK